MMNLQQGFASKWPLRLRNKNPWPWSEFRAKVTTMTDSSRAWPISKIGFSEVETFHSILFRFATFNRKPGSCSSQIHSDSIFHFRVSEFQPATRFITAKPGCGNFSNIKGG